MITIDQVNQLMEAQEQRFHGMLSQVFQHVMAMGVNTQPMDAEMGADQQQPFMVPDGEIPHITPEMAARYPHPSVSGIPIVSQVVADNLLQMADDQD